LGDFIEDLRGHQVSLTSLIFGRHHKAFGLCEFVQISQSCPGRAVVHCTTSKGIGEEDLRALFDFSNVEIFFHFVIRKSPYRSPIGKVPLLIKDQTN